MGRFKKDVEADGMAPKRQYDWCARCNDYRCNNAPRVIQVVYVATPAGQVPVADMDRCSACSKTYGVKIGSYITGRDYPEAVKYNITPGYIMRLLSNTKFQPITILPLSELATVPPLETGPL